MSSPVSSYKRDGDALSRSRSQSMQLDTLRWISSYEVENRTCALILNLS